MAAEERVTYIYINKGGSDVIERIALLLVERVNGAFAVAAGSPASRNDDRRLCGQF